MPKSDLKRLSEIQNNLISHVKKEMKTEDDHLYMATMLLKHSIVLYKTLLDDEEIKNMLGHVIETLEQDYPDILPQSKRTIH